MVEEAAEVVVGKRRWSMQAGMKLRVAVEKLAQVGATITAKSSLMPHSPHLAHPSSQLQPVSKDSPSWAAVPRAHHSKQSLPPKTFSSPRCPFCFPRGRWS